MVTATVSCALPTTSSICASVGAVTVAVLPLTLAVTDTAPSSEETSTVISVVDGVLGLGLGVPPEPTLTVVETALP